MEILLLLAQQATQQVDHSHSSLNYDDIVLTIIALIMTAGVPWAYFMERRLARIEAEVRLAQDHEKRIRKIEIICVSLGGTKTADEVLGRSL